MKKIFLLVGFAICTVYSIHAQSISDHAIGLRFCSGNGLGAEISYQKPLGETNRLEVDLGFGNDFSDFKATGLYQWVWSLEEKFNWYAGFGGGIISTSQTGLYGAGVIGIEYNFNLPILISLDYRPEIGISDGLNGLNSDTALSIRYQF